MTFTSYWGCQPAAQTVVGPTAYLHCPQTSLYGCHTAVQHCPPAAEQGTPVGPTAYWHCPPTSLYGCQTAVQGCGLPTTAPQQQQNVTLTPVCQITNITPVCSTGIPIICSGAAAYAAPQQQQNVTLTPVCQITNITPVCSTGIPIICSGAAAVQQATVTPPTSIGCGTFATICNPTHIHCTGPVAPQQQQNVTLTPVCQITNITPVCSTGIPIICSGAAAVQQATVTPPTSIGCGTFATICNPTHIHCTGQ